MFERERKLIGIPYSKQVCYTYFMLTTFITCMYEQLKSFIVDVRIQL